MYDIMRRAIVENVYCRFTQKIFSLYLLAFHQQVKNLINKLAIDTPAIIKQLVNTHRVGGGVGVKWCVCGRGMVCNEVHVHTIIREKLKS